MLLKFITHYLAECDECHETINPDEAEDAGWWLSLDAATGRETRIDLCYECGHKLTDDYFQLTDSEADRIITKNRIQPYSS